MADELIDADAVEEEEAPDPSAAVVQGEVRPLPATRDPGALDAWRGDVRTVAVAAAGGIVAGAATVVAVNAVRAGAKRGLGRARRRRRAERDRVVASRSFLVDIHVLGR